MRWYEKFFILKTEDINRYLSLKEQRTLSLLQDTIAQGRFDDGKTSDNGYYIVNQDEPYAKAVKELIEMGENIKDN